MYQRLFGTKLDNKIRKRNKSKYDNNISIFNDAFLEARIFPLGQMLDINKNEIRHNNILFELENITPPVSQLIHELDDYLNRIVKKLVM